MLNIEAIHRAIDEFVLKAGPEEYDVRIPDVSNKQRNYLGLSALGGECRRATWYDFRKVAKKEFPPRMLRLFRRGDLEEYRFMYLLRGIGFEIFERDTDGKQFKVTDFGGHLSGSMDGVGKAPPKFGYIKPFLLEYKTVNDKGFQKYIKDGLKITNIKYWTQCQGYMGYNELEGALFCIVNKNDDTLYFEWIPFDKHAFRRLVDSAEDLITSTEPPEKLSKNPAWYQCKFCDFQEVCHRNAPSIKSCRSCKFASPSENATWICAKGGEYGTVCGEYSDIARV